MAGEDITCPQCGVKLALPDADELAEDESADNTISRAKDRKRGSSSRRSQKRSQQKWTDSTNVSLLQSGLIGAGATVIYYLLMLPLRSFYFGQLFLERGWVPFVLVLLLGWSMGFLFLKTRKLASQKSALLIDMLPTSISEEISVETVDEFIEHVESMPPKLMGSFMVSRIKRGLEHFAVRHSNPEVANMMMSQSEIDAAAVHSSYSVVKVFIWAIPILGFIGTVQGISDAVGGFSGAMADAQDIEVLKDSLNGVTSGLGVAFDTTLVALVMSLMASFPVSIIQKREEDFLGKVDEYCSENFLKRLNDAGGLADVASHTQAMMEALANAMQQNRGTIVKDLQDSQEKMAELHAEQVEHYRAVSEALESDASDHRRTVSGEVVEMVGSVQSSVGEMATQMSSMMEQQMTTAVESAELHQQRVEELMAQIAGPVDEASAAHVVGLTEGLERLNSVLTDLGERQVVIQQEPRRKWFQSRKEG